MGEILEFRLPHAQRPSETEVDAALDRYEAAETKRLNKEHMAESTRRQAEIAAEFEKTDAA